MTRKIGSPVGDVVAPGEIHPNLARKRGMRSEPLPYPAGWFAVALSDEVPPSGHIVRRLMGRDIVLFRDSHGALCVSEAICPHLGAHLGGGKVVEDRLRCPFHGFEFDVTGKCVSTPYPSGHPPANVRLGTFVYEEQAGVVLVFCSRSGEEPWELSLGSGWENADGGSRTVTASVQDITENLVDFGHFESIHGFHHAELAAPVTMDGPGMNVSVKYYRTATPAPDKVADTTTVALVGMGVSIVEVTLGASWRMHQLVLTTPVDPDVSEMRVLVQAVPQEGSRLSGMPAVVRHPASRAFGRIVANAVLREIKKDASVWSSKAHLEKPGIARGDGPLGVYRRWAAQFYSTGTDVGD